MDKEIEAWERNYQKGRYNNWPYDILVSLVMKFYGAEKRERIKILDLGCGGGNNTYFLAKEGFQTYAIDGSSTGVEITKKKLNENDLEAQCQVANFKNLPYENNYFNCIIDRASIYCNLWEDIKIIFKEIHRVLKYGGKYIGFLPNLNHPDIIYGKEIEKNTYANFTQGAYGHSDFAHFFSKDEIIDVLNDFKIEDILEHNLNSIYNNDNSIIRLAEFIVVARK